MRYVTRFLKIVGRLILFLLVLSILISLIVQIPAVQTYLVNRIGRSLSEQLDTEVRVGRVHVSLFSKTKLKSVYLADQSGDTLFYAGQIRAGISILSLLSRRVEIKRFLLEDATVRINRKQVDSTYNFSFLSTLFPTDTTPSTSQPWALKFGDFAIRNTQLNFDDQVGEVQMSAAIGSLELSVNNFDPAKQIIDLQVLNLENTDFSYLSNAPPPPPDTTTSGPMTFPDIGWDISVGRLTLNDDRFTYRRDRAAPREGIDWNNLAVKGIALNARGIQWKDQLIAADLQELRLKDHSGFSVDQLQFKGQVDSTGITAYDFVLETPTSRIKSNFEVTYRRWEEWLQLQDPTLIEIDFKQSNLSFRDINFFTPLFATIPLGNVQTEGIDIDGAVTGNFNRLDIRNLALSISQTLDLVADGQVEQLTDLKRLAVNIRIEEANTSYDRLQRILPEGTLPVALRQLGNFRLHTEIVGSIDSFRTQQFDLQTDVYTGFKGNAVVINVTDPKRTRFDLEILELKTRTADWTAFLSPKVTGLLDSLGNITYQGNLTGTLHQFKLAGNLQTSIGSLQSDLSLDFNQNYTSGSYAGTLELDAFDLGALIDQTNTVGKVSLSAKGEGSGFSVDSLRARINAVVKEITFRDYTYTDIKVDGQFRQKQFVGSTRSNDPNAKFIFDGMLNLTDSLPTFDFELTVDTINLARLNLSTDTLGIHANAAFLGRGNSLDNLDGEINISNIRIANDSISYQTDYLNIEARQGSDSLQQLLIRSDFLQAQFTGKYSLARLPGSIIRYVNDFISMEPLVRDSVITDSLKLADAGQELDFSISLTDATPLAFLPIGNIPYLEGAAFKGNFNSTGETMNIRGWIAKPQLEGIKADSILIRTNGGPKKINLLVDAREVSSSPTNRLPKLSLKGEISNQILSLELESRNEKDSLQLDLRGDVSRWQAGYKLSFRPIFLLNDRRWNIPDNNAIYYQPGFLYLDHFALFTELQEIYIQSQGEIDTSQAAPVIIGFNNFKLSEISSLLNMEENFLEGAVNGRLKLVNVLEAPRFLSDITISELTLNEEPLGELAIKAEQQDQNLIKLDVNLAGQYNEVQVAGTYPLQKGDMDLIATIKRLELRIIDPYISQLISETKGNLTGEIAVKGTLKNLDIEGEVTLDSFQTKVNFLNTVYSIPNHRIKITERAIELGKTMLYDADGHPAELSGRIRHRSFTDFRFNIDVESDQFQFLDTKEPGDNIFYGELILDARIAILGTPNLPIFDIRAKTLKGTDFYLLPLAGSESVVLEENYILFGNPNTFTEEDSTRQVYELENPFGLELFINLELNPDALFHLVVDPETGDQLDCRGNSDMTIAATSTGTFTVKGNYIIQEGRYTFNYEKLLKKQFDIQEGSSVFFPGDPLQAKFDITAIYTANTTTYPLIQSETSLSPEELRSAGRRSAIRVLLMVSGKLENPEIAFDLQLPANQNDLIDNAVARKLEELRTDADELNKQVFGLLLFNNFFTSQTAASGLADVGQNVVLSSVSGLISSQLNNIANRYIKGIDVKLDVDSYKSQYLEAGVGGTVTELNLGLSKQLFNNRLTIQAGGNLNIDNSSAGGNSSDFSNIAGDFLLEYKLTPSGNYRLQVFQRSQYDVFDDANDNKTGIGIFFQKSFK